MNKEEAISCAISQQNDPDGGGWFRRWPDGKLQIEFQEFDIRAFIVVLEVLGYRILSEEELQEERINAILSY